MKALMESWKEQYLKEDDRYINHVGKFITYLMLPSVNKGNKPATITKEDLDKCIGYYVDRGNINSVNSMNSHLESIKAFYNYLIKKEYLSDNIVPVATYSDFKENLATKYCLKESIERLWVQDDDIALILDRLDEYFIKSDYNKLGKTAKQRYIYWLSLRIYIKLCLIAPAKKNVLLSLKFSDFTDDFRIVEINNIKVRIPNGLRNNILYSLNFVKQINKKNYKNEEKIFYYISGLDEETGKKDSKLNTWFCKFLKQYNILDIPKSFQSYSVEIVANSTIFNMISQGTNPYYISKITGVTISSLEDKYYKNIPYIEHNIDANKAINNSIAQCEYYHYI